MNHIQAYNLTLIAQSQRQQIHHQPEVWLLSESASPLVCSLADECPESFWRSFWSSCSSRNTWFLMALKPARCWDVGLPSVWVSGSTCPSGSKVEPTEGLLLRFCKGVKKDHQNQEGNKTRNCELCNTVLFIVRHAGLREWTGTSFRAKASVIWTSSRSEPLFGASTSRRVLGIQTKEGM